MSDGGKGSAPRPYSVSQSDYDARWEAIFGSDKAPKKLNNGYDHKANIRISPLYVGAIVLAWVVGLFMLLP